MPHLPCRSCSRFASPSKADLIGRKSLNGLSTLQLPSSESIRSRKSSQPPGLVQSLGCSSSTVRQRIPMPSFIPLFALQGLFINVLLRKQTNCAIASLLVPLYACGAGVWCGGNYVDMHVSDCHKLHRKILHPFLIRYMAITLTCTVKIDPCVRMLILAYTTQHLRSCPGI